MSQGKMRKAAEQAAEIWEEEVRKEFEKDLQNPERAAIKEIANAKTNFCDFVMNVWFPICIDNGEHKVRTVAFYNQIARSVIRNFEDYTLQDMNFFTIQKYFIFLKKEKGYSAQYRHHQYRVMKMVFDFAVKQGVLFENPMENVTKPILERRKVDALSEDEAKEFFEALKTCPLDFRCMLTLLTNFKFGVIFASVLEHIVFGASVVLCFFGEAFSHVDGVFGEVEGQFFFCVHGSYFLSFFCLLFGTLFSLSVTILYHRVLFIGSLYWYSASGGRGEFNGFIEVVFASFDCFINFGVLAEEPLLDFEEINVGAEDEFFFLFIKSFKISLE